MMLGTHVSKSWSTNHAVVALSSGEAEYSGMVKGGSQSSHRRNLGRLYPGPMQTNADASAATGVR